jgi:phosphatidylserine decarboxylase
MLYKIVPFSAFSGFAQWVEKQEIKSKFMRKVLLGSYVRVFGCNMDEATKLVENFSSFGEFFSRPLKKGVRSFDKVDGIISSTDGKVLHCGEAHFDDSGSVFPEQVKGSLYKLSDLIGPEAAKSFARKKDCSIFYCTVYLAPGDYHRFHCPTNMKIDSVETFSGEVLSVAPFMMKLVPNLLCMNERKAVNGTWRHGQISIIPVGAANVGSVVLDENIKPAAKIATGAEIGRFELGSTVVYIFEAPSSFSWKVSPGQSIRLGQTIFSATKQKGGWF